MSAATRLVVSEVDYCCSALAAASPVTFSIDLRPRRSAGFDKFLLRVESMGLGTEVPQKLRHFNICETLSCPQFAVMSHSTQNR